MKKFKVTFIKEERLTTGGRKPIQLCEQEYETTGENVTIVVPAGFQVMSVTEFLPPVRQLDHLKNEKATHNAKERDG